MMYGIIGAILLLLVLLTCGFFIRRQFYKEIDKLEAWKIEIMNRPVTEELGKVKRLNMGGEAESLFEGWRKDWEDLLNEELPAVEDKLFEIEEHTDKYRFKKAKEVQAGAEAILQNAEQKIKDILDGVNELMDAEKESRKEVEELGKIFKDLKKQLLTRRHTYGKGIKSLDLRVDGLAEKFARYHELTEAGNYLEAKKLTDELKAETETLQEDVGKIPDLLAETESLLPMQFAELKEGYKEMAAQGFALDHLQFDEEMKELTEKLSAYRKQLEQADTADVEEGIREIKERIETIYDILEKEAYAKNYVLKHFREVKDILDEVREENKRLKTETESVQETYQLHEENMAVPAELEKQLEKLAARLAVLEVKIPENETIYSVLSEQLKEMEGQIEKLRDDQKTFNEFLQNLRKEEMEARAKIAELKRTIQDMRRLVERSNIPGLPDSYRTLYEAAWNAIRDTAESLHATPLNMEKVNRHLLEAEQAVGNFEKSTKALMENVQLAEKVIQYGNRYRAKYKKVADGLERAEVAFRRYDYEKALEEAATTVEAVEPGALKKIEKMLETEELL
ncbi:septation ring formation regulator EzrA [Heyndrickxia coagulans]|uniref:septation ring formation regulator EzrA n=1 Tax=Heyndrickxia coagulans TaxID=1398 RepID=UPI001F373E03|nr:septation ring formation regulator EzrA [Heyndrickxia coagulans]UJZ86614.1 septation ring formation regulator EzrA [Heyndrickxia coagulans]